MRLRHIKSVIGIAVLLLSTVAGGLLHGTAVEGEPIGAKALTLYERKSGNTSPTIQKGKITDPSVAAARLYQAWKRKSKRAALKVASASAVSKLLSTRWRPMTFKGCQNTGGAFSCIYHDAKLDFDLAMEIEGGASAGYHVESVSFSSEAAFAPAKSPHFTALSQLGQPSAQTGESPFAGHEMLLVR